MTKERLNPLNDFAFQKAMGEKGDEVQLIAFLNAVLKRTGKDHIESVEILEDKDLPADVAGGKAGKLDVLAKLADKTRVNIEVQLSNQYNMERRSLDYWAWHYGKGIGSGQDYSQLPAVIGMSLRGAELRGIFSVELCRNGGSFERKFIIPSGLIPNFCKRCIV